MASTYLSFTPSSTGNQRTFTFSFWVKRSKLGLGGTGQVIYCQSYGSDGYQFKIEFTSNDEFRLYNSKGASDAINLKTSKLFKDTSSWYAITIQIDTTQSTESDRAKIYVNGVQETAFGTSTYPTQNLELDVNAAAAQIIGAKYSGSYSTYFDGLLSQFIFVDGTAYAASTFGSTNTVSGEWTPNPNPTVTYGSNGYKLTFEDAVLGDDTSGNTNDFTMSGSGTSTKDCPSNVFATWNPAFMPFNIGNGRADNGGTTIGSPGGDSSSLASMGARSGKYYWEIRVQNAVNTRSCGVVRSDLQGQSSTSAIYPGGNGNASNFTSAYNMVNGFVQTVTGGTQAQQGSLATLTTGDFLGVALDIDNLDIKWYKNDSLVTTTSLTSAWIENGLFIMPCNRLDGNQFVEYNFGNGCFGSTQLTGTTYPGEGGLGIFKYEPPSGFTALSTKGLNL